MGVLATAGGVVESDAEGPARRAENIPLVMAWGKALRLSPVGNRGLPLRRLEGDYSLLPSGLLFRYFLAGTIVALLPHPRPYVLPRSHGTEAVYRVITWEEQGEFTVSEESDFPEQNTQESTELLLMEGVRLMDESRA